MHNIPYDLIVDEARRILGHQKLRIELKQFTILNQKLNFDLAFVLSMTYQETSEDSILMFQTRLKNQLVHYFNNSVDVRSANYYTVSQTPLVFIDEFRHNYGNTYPMTFMAYVFTKI